MCVAVCVCWGGGGELTVVSTFPLSCREHSFVSHIPFPIHLSPSGQKKNLLLLTRGRGLSEHLIKWNRPPPPHHPHPSSLFYLVSEAAKLQEKKGGREDVPPPFCCVYVCVCVCETERERELWLIFNDWLKKIKREDCTCTLELSLGLSQRSL